MAITAERDPERAMAATASFAADPPEASASPFNPTYSFTTDDMLKDQRFRVNILFLNSVMPCCSKWTLITDCRPQEMCDMFVC